MRENQFLIFMKDYGSKSNEFMKSYNMLLMNGIIGILGAIVISYASFQRWEWTFVHAVPELVEKGDWGLVINTISLLYLVISILAMANYSENPKVNKKSHKILFVASIVGFVPFVSSLTSVLAIISSLLYLFDYQQLSNEKK